MESMIIEVALVQRIAAYLAGRPYREVFEILDQLRQLRKADDPAPETPPQQQ